MASTVRASTWVGGSDTAGAGASAESGAVFNKANSLTGTTPIAIPTATGTNFSWPKFLGLEVTADGSTSLSNLGVKQASTPTTGLQIFWLATTSYATPAAVADTASGSNSAVPSGYTLMTNSNVTYDATGAASTTGTAVCGKYLKVSLGVSNTYAGGAGSATALPTLTISYDEQ